MKKRLKIVVLFGGKSPEHEVSIESAKRVIQALDRKKYEVASKKIPKNGNFDFSILKKYDVVFPILHGPFGEDGTVQGALKLAGVPFVGAGVLGSAVGMDKDVMKRLLRERRVPVGEFLAFRVGEKINFSDVEKKLGLPVFIKPSNAGSSVGVSKVKNKKEFKKAVKNSFRYDTKIIIEKMIYGREVECAVIGNNLPTPSLPGEIIPKDEFYTYDAKYSEDSGTIYQIPAKLPSIVVKKIQKLAVETFKTLSCEVMGRVDFFLSRSGKVYVNEINTIPGPVMFRRMWEASGVPFPKLLDKLVYFALERFKQEQKLKNTFK